MSHEWRPIEARQPGGGVPMLVSRLIRLLPLLLLVACATINTAPTGPENLRARLQVQRRDLDFFNGSYSGTQTDCFPPPGRRICTKPTGESDSYEVSGAIAAEEYGITVKDWTGFTRPELTELAHLVAAQVTTQRGFERFTINWKLETSACGSYKTANTYGTVSGPTYSGTTTVRTHTVCANSLTLHVLAYSDQAAIDRGVLYRVGSGLGKSDVITPYRSLYKGTTPFDSRFDMPPEPIGDSIITYPIDAWKHPFDAKGLAAALRERYRVSDSTPYEVIDERAENLAEEERRREEPLEKYKLNR